MEEEIRCADCDRRFKDVEGLGFHNAAKHPELIPKEKKQLPMKKIKGWGIFLIIVVLLITVTYGIVGSENLPSLLAVETGGIDMGTAVGFLLFGILSVFSYSDRYQLAYSAKSARGLKHALSLVALPIVIAAGFLLLIGLFMAKNVPGLDSGLVFTEALRQFLSPALLPFPLHVLRCLPVGVKT